MTSSPYSKPKRTVSRRLAHASSDNRFVVRILTTLAVVSLVSTGLVSMLPQSNIEQEETAITSRKTGGGLRRVLTGGNEERKVPRRESLPRPSEEDAVVDDDKLDPEDQVLVPARIGETTKQVKQEQVVQREELKAHVFGQHPRDRDSSSTDGEDDIPKIRLDSRSADEEVHIPALPESKQESKGKHSDEDHAEVDPRSTDVDREDKEESAKRELDHKEEAILQDRKQRLVAIKE